MMGRGGHVDQAAKESGRVRGVPLRLCYKNTLRSHSCPMRGAVTVIGYVGRYHYHSLGTCVNEFTFRQSVRGKIDEGKSLFHYRLSAANWRSTIFATKQIQNSGDAQASFGGGGVLRQMQHASAVMIYWSSYVTTTVPFLYIDFRQRQQT